MSPARIPLLLIILLPLLLLIVLSPAASSASPTTSSWFQGRRAPPAARLDVTVLLRHREGGVERLQRALEEVSFPGSPLYGRHLSAEQVAAAVAPADGDIAAVLAWLGQDAALSPTRDAVLVRGVEAGAAEALFGVSVHEFWHPSRAAPVLRSAEPAAVPAALAGVVHRVGGLHAAELRDPPAPPRRDGDPGITVSPPVIQKAYGVPTDPAPAGFNASVAMGEFEQAQFLNSDVRKFQRTFGLAVQNITVVGPNNGGYFGEASLDACVLATTANGIDTWAINQDQFDLATWGQLVLSTPGAPRVLSVSWGSGESSIVDRDRADAELLKLGTMGYSVLAASGDQGTGAQGGIFGGCKKFDPTYPASSAHATAVGGTFLPASGAAEQGWGDSGGGFSAYFAAPSWQAGAVANYTSSGAALPPSKYYNASGRVTPDVSCLATNVNSESEGYLGTLSGTSAATPMFAGMVARLNGERAAQGLPYLGFLNPWLYSTAAAAGAFTDVTEGNNKNPSCPAGFPAAPGFDAVTGLGTPVYPALLKAALAV